MRSADPARLRGATLYLDCASGIAGDMMVGALVDLGVPETVVRDTLAQLPLTGYRVEFARVVRGGLTGTKFRVLIDAAEEYHLATGHAHSGAHHHHHHHDDAPHHHHHDDAPHHHHHDDAPHHHHHHHHDDAPHQPHDHGYGVGGHSEASAHRHTHYGSIRHMLVEAPIPGGVRRRALSMFDRIAVVEARLHGVAVEEVAFHEVGAVDSIVDVVSVAAALEWLQPARVVSRRVPLGRGSVMTAHGRLPVPAPATLELLQGVPVEDGGIDGELTTPTGAVILADAVTAYGPLPPLTVEAVGWGAGDRELPGRPNLLRVVAGRPELATEIEHGVVLEANLDDMTPELVAPLLGALLDAGARDAWIQPILMKKGRPGYLVAALVEEAGRAAVERVLFTESTTLGVRRHTVERTVLRREIVEVETEFGPVPVKLAGEPGAYSNAAPEFEACRRIAAERGVPLKRVYAAALAAFWRK